MFMFEKVIPAKTKIYNRLLKLVCAPAHYLTRNMLVRLIAIIVAILVISQTFVTVVVANPLKINNANVYSINLIGIGKFSNTLLNKKFLNFVIDEFFTIETQMDLSQFANDFKNEPKKRRKKATIFNFATNDNVKFPQLSQLNREHSGYTTQILVDENPIDIWSKLEIMSKKHIQIDHIAIKVLVLKTNQQWIERNPFNI